MHRIIDRLSPHLALAPARRRYGPDTVLIVDDPGPHPRPHRRASAKSTGPLVRPDLSSGSIRRRLTLVRTTIDVGVSRVRYTGRMSDIGSSRDPAIELVDVLPIKQQRPVGRGGRLLVTSVELWSHGLRWHGSEIPQPENAGPHLVHYWMRDDVGTTYHGAGSGGSSRSCDDGVYSVANSDDIDHAARSNGGHPWPGGEGGNGSSWWTFLLDFEPAVPLDARQIILGGPPLTHGDEIVVQLAAGTPGQV